MGWESAPGPAEDNADSGDSAGAVSPWRRSILLEDALEQLTLELTRYRLAFLYPTHQLVAGVISWRPRTGWPTPHIIGSGLA